MEKRLGSRRAESDILQPGYDDPDCDPYRSLFRDQRKLCELFFLRFDPVGPAESSLKPCEGLEVQLEVRLTTACSFFIYKNLVSVFSV